MKKLLLIIICALLICPYGIASGRAAASPPDGSDHIACASSLQNTYAQAANTTAYFFAQKDLSTSLFAVPYTYYVRLLRDDGQWYYVQYAEDEGIYKALYGYVLKSDFITLDQPPAITYLFKSVTITYTAGNQDTSLPTLGGIDKQAAFYGTYYSGATAYSYVLCENSFGYIMGANDDYPLNELYVKDSEYPSDEEELGDGGLVTAVIIVCLAAGAILLVFLTSKKKKND